MGIKGFSNTEIQHSAIQNYDYYSMYIFVCKRDVDFTLLDLILDNF